jgi:cobalamin biosynthesis protein CobT
LILKKKNEKTNVNKTKVLKILFDSDNYYDNLNDFSQNFYFKQIQFLVKKNEKITIKEIDNDFFININNQTKFLLIVQDEQLKNKDELNNEINYQNNDENNDQNNDENNDQNNDENNDQNNDQINDQNNYEINDKNHNENNEENNEENNDKNYENNLKKIENFNQNKKEGINKNEKNIINNVSPKKKRPYLIKK